MRWIVEVVSSSVGQVGLNFENSVFERINLVILKCKNFPDNSQWKKKISRSHRDLKCIRRACHVRLKNTRGTATIKTTNDLGVDAIKAARKKPKMK
jgi:hypothetical protein